MRRNSPGYCVGRHPLGRGLPGVAAKRLQGVWPLLGSVADSWYKNAEEKSFQVFLKIQNPTSKSLNEDN